MCDSAKPAPNNIRGIFKEKGFVFFLVARLGAVFSMQIQAIVVAWQLYDLTHQAISLAYAGLAQFIPMVLLILPAGDLLDRYSRKVLLIISWSIQCLCSAGLLGVSLTEHPSLVTIYTLLVLFGCSCAFSAPSLQSLLPQVVSRDRLPQAIVMNTSIMEIAVISGPLLGGLLYLVNAACTYAACFICTLIAVFAMKQVVVNPIETQAPQTDTSQVKTTSWQRFIAGLMYIWKNPIILGAISLDLFAVLLGDVVALLPIYADSILHAGPLGLGALRAASAIGALLVSLYLGVYPIKRKVGKAMFLAVAIFGLSNLAFSLSTSLWISLLALTIAGAADMVSVYIRSALIQLATPDHMRGRVNAVNMLFLGSSNQLGEFRAGSLASWMGAESAGITGGFATLAIVVAWALFFPKLLGEDSLDSIKSD